MDEWQQKQILQRVGAFMYLQFYVFLHGSTVADHPNSLESCGVMEKGTRLPGVGELRARIDYGDLSLQRCKFFHEDCRFFIRHYVDKDERKAQGTYWWPSDREHRNANRLQYSTQKQHITDTMRLLFLRINIQYHSNLRYKSKNDVHSARKPAARKGHGPNRDQSARGTSVNDPIDLENAHNQTGLARNRSNGPGKGLPSAASSSNHAATMETQPGRQPTRALAQQESQETDPYEVPKTPELPGRSNATQESCAGRRVAQSSSAALSDATIEERPAASSGTKRATTAATQHSPKRPKVKLTLRRASNYKPERTPQRKSSRKRSFVYGSLDFTGEGPSPSENAQPLEAVAEAVAEEEAPSEAAQDAHVAEQEATPGAVPATAPLNAAPLEVESTRAINAFLFSRFNAISSSGTPEERSAQVLEHLWRGARVPEAPMGLVHDPALQFLAARRQTSPPPPEMGEHEWHETANVPLQSTESVKETTTTTVAATASDCVGTAHISTMSPGAASSRVAPERSTTQTRTEHSLAAKSPAAEAPKKQASAARESEKSSTGPQLQPAAAQSELRLMVVGPRLLNKWKEAPPLQDLTMARIKREIPLELSSQFRGFKFTLLGPESRRHQFEIRDGDEQEFVHLKFDVQEVMEDTEEQNQGQSEYLGFQLRIEELRDTGVREDRADS
ncbi:hypothetical protein LMH87_009581 [Akanthomyces muscarius]|uniref:Uncharacterized protein n=1 Tax=Akanthomyces muscarius TaxID=2231603 RepID=A0A9W8QCD4_AKAMU|nr:hypothetical protein LMH87_009581 [Akanthomyces muscarius]KAJ4153075.1 hypothetical protein LMH87_009581 [Akanthomyces muscarius]